MRRGYMAFAWGLPGRQRGTVDAPIDRHPHAREKMAVRQGGREAVTHWELLESFAGRDGKPIASLLACELETGRTHQIRVHLAHIGHPLMGDAVYGPHFKTKANHLGPELQATWPRLGGRPCMPICWYWSTRDRRITPLGSASAGGFASPSGRPESGAMTQAASEKRYYYKKL